jgi:hypothetical protein
MVLKPPQKPMSQKRVPFIESNLEVPQAPKKPAIPQAMILAKNVAQGNALS